MSDYKEAVRILATSDDDRVKEVIGALIRNHDQTIKDKDALIRKLKDDHKNTRDCENNLNRKVSGVLGVLKFSLNEVQRDIVQLYLDGQIDKESMLKSVKEQQ